MRPDLSGDDVYKLPLPRWYSKLALGILGSLSLGGVWLFVTALISGDGSEALLGAGVCGVLAWNWFIVLNMPYEVRFESADRAIFRSLRGDTRIAAQEVLAIIPSFFDGYVLKYDHGTLRLSSMFRGALGQIVGRIRAANPRL